MSRAPLLAALGAAILLGVAWTWERKAGSTALFEPVVPAIEAAPVCPWRETEKDLRTFFPAATHYISRTLILSGRRVELSQRLGRMPEPEENALVVHAIFSHDAEIGCVLIRRVKGEHGAIELVLAVNGDGTIQGIRFQRMREPDGVAGALRDPGWQSRFLGRTHDHGWDADDTKDLPEPARVSGRAVGEGMRSLLILRAAAEGPSQKSAHH